VTVKLIKYLQGGDLRSIANVQELRTHIKNQKDFDSLFQFLHSKDRVLIMRAADALEKISREHPNYLWAHQGEILQFLRTEKHK
jgi:hypothetical protein